MNAIFKTSESPSGKLACHVEGDERSVWMYLKDLDKDKVIGDAPICSLMPLQSLKDFKANYIGEGAPPLVEAYTAEDAVLPDINSESIGIVWGPDEMYVDVTLESKPISRIENGKKRGLSIFTIKKGPWGEPWEK